MKFLKYLKYLSIIGTVIEKFNTAAQDGEITGDEVITIIKPFLDKLNIKVKAISAE